MTWRRRGRPGGFGERSGGGLRCVEGRGAAGEGGGGASNADEGEGWGELVSAGW